MKLLFDNFPVISTNRDSPENCEKFIFLFHVACVSGAILVVFSDFGLGQPKRHFFDTFFNFDHEGAQNLTKITYNMKI